MTYAGFIDVKKAYDTVWRAGLWKRLWEEGVRGKMWRVVKGMYQTVESAVLVGDESTEWFKLEAGVRQGCVMSPILFIVHQRPSEGAEERFRVNPKKGKSEVMVFGKKKKTDQ